MENENNPYVQSEKKYYIQIIYLIRDIIYKTLVTQTYYLNKTKLITI